MRDGTPTRERSRACPCRACRRPRGPVRAPLRFRVPLPRLLDTLPPVRVVRAECRSFRRAGRPHAHHLFLSAAEQAPSASGSGAGDARARITVPGMRGKILIQKAGPDQAVTRYDFITGPSQSVPGSGSGHRHRSTRSAHPPTRARRRTGPEPARRQSGTFGSGGAASGTAAAGGGRRLFPANPLNPVNARRSASVLGGSGQIAPALGGPPVPVSPRPARPRPVRRSAPC